MLLNVSGWGWKDVEYYFKKLENFVVPDYPSNDLHGHNGYLTISSVPYRSKVADAFMEGANATGLPLVDYNALTQTGVSYLQVSVTVTATVVAAMLCKNNPLSKNQCHYG